MQDFSASVQIYNEQTNDLISNFYIILIREMTPNLVAIEKLH